MFKIGDRVVCVDARLAGGKMTEHIIAIGQAENSTGLKLGEEYVVHDVCECPCGRKMVNVKAHLRQSSCDNCGYLMDGPYNLAWRFVKLDGLLDRAEIVEIMTDPVAA